jgi:hypothetical protein
MQVLKGNKNPSAAFTVCPKMKENIKIKVKVNPNRADDR